MKQTKKNSVVRNSKTLNNIEKTVFVVTYGRSGSTLTQSYLNTFPDTCVRGENRNLLYHICKIIHTVSHDENYSSRREDSKLERDARRPYLRDILGTASDPWFGVENVSPNSLELSLAQLFIDEIIKPEKGIKTIGVKEIRWFSDRSFFPKFLKILDNIFPNVHFIFQSRDWEEVSRSGWWVNIPKDQVKLYISGANSLFRSAIMDHKKSIIIDYKNLTKDLNGFQEIADFLGQKFDEKTALTVLSNRLRH